MAATRLDVVGIGNAIVDVITDAEDGFLRAEGMTPGSMMLIDADRAEALHAGMGATLEASGGSAANTMAGIASLGGSAGYIGKLRDDALGALFAEDIRSLGVVFSTPPSAEGPATARCLIYVSPDGQRTMNTFLGACADLRPEDIDSGLIKAAQITYLEGYLFDPPHAKEAFRKAAKIARDAGRKIALSLSDSFCVGRYREEFLDFIGEHVDILFANEDEIVALYETDLNNALGRSVAYCDVVAVTRGAKGSVICAGETRILSPAAPGARVVDTTGAGDLYAAGFLYGLCRERDLAECGRIGGLAAAEVIGHYGARPSVVLADLLQQGRLPD